MFTFDDTATIDRAERPDPIPVIDAPWRVVIADDHPLYRRGIVRSLEDSGAFDVVAEASDGATALTLIRRHRPDVALLDVRMPALDGIDVIAALARHGPPVPVVLLSAFDEDQLVTAGLDAGAAAYVSKGADRDVICLDVAAAARAGAARSPGALHGVPDLLRGRVPNWTPRLTVTEHELLRLMAGALDKRELGRLTGADEPTVRRRLDTLLAKLGADDLGEALEIARAHDIVR
jgi:two-component system, NarL family, nitrate/nitrite response regulator NarL